MALQCGCGKNKGHVREIYDAACDCMQAVVTPITKRGVKLVDRVAAKSFELANRYDQKLPRKICQAADSVHAWLEWVLANKLATGAHENAPSHHASHSARPASAQRRHNKARQNTSTKDNSTSAQQ